MANGEKNGFSHIVPSRSHRFALGMQYGLSVFEGMKAYRYDDGRVAIFRLDRHHERFNKSLVRMVMPEVPWELFRDSITQVVSVDRDWVPPGPDLHDVLALPYVFGTEEKVGLRAAEEFTYFVLTAPFKPNFTKAPSREG